MHRRTYDAWSWSKLHLPGIVLFVAAVSALCCMPAAADDTVYMFSYFNEPDGTDGLHLAYSLDGLSYHAVNNDTAITPPSGTLMRDPNIIYGPDNKFHLLYTTSWTGATFGYSDSSNLVDWSAKRSISITGFNPEEIWAPESYWDAPNNRYIVCWSSGFNSGGEQKKIYYSTTADYSTFSAPAILYDPGFRTIDATIVKDGLNYRLFCKDDITSNIYMTPASTSPTGPYATSPLMQVSPVGSGAEGPSVIKIGNTWYCYSDAYSNTMYLAMSSSDDMATWTDYTNKVIFPSNAHHGTVFAVPRSAADYLIAHVPRATSQIEFDGQASGSTDYLTGGNWLGGTVPGIGQIAIIQSGHTADLSASPAGTLTELWVGETSPGVLNISGGTVNVSNWVCSGRNNGSAGSVLNFSGGKISAGNVSLGATGANASGTINISGSAAIAVAGSILVGEGGSGEIVQNDNSSITSNNYSSIGIFGTGTYRLQGGSLTVKGNLNVGQFRNSHGDLYVEGGNLSANALFVASGDIYGTARGNAVGAMHQSGGSVSVTGSGNAIVIGGRLTSYGVGSYELSGDGTFDSGSSNIQVGGLGQGSFVQSGGTLYARQGLSISQSSGATGSSYSISGGTMLQTSTAARLIVGGGGAGILTASGSGLLDSSGGLRLSGGSSGNGAVHLDGGTICTPIVEDGGGTSTFHFNGGTLKARNTTATFMQNLDTADVEAGGAIIDSNGFDVTIRQRLLAGSPSGGLTKNGPGLLTLIGNPAYSGQTVINAGQLQLNTGSTTLAGISGEGDLIVGSAATPTQLTASNIDLATLTIAANSTVVIGPVAGGPAVPEPGVWLLLLIAATAVFLKTWIY